MGTPSCTSFYGSDYCIDFTLYNVNVLIHNPDRPKIEKNYVSTWYKTEHFNYSIPRRKNGKNVSESPFSTTERESISGLAVVLYFIFVLFFNTLLTMLP